MKYLIYCILFVFTLTSCSHTENTSLKEVDVCVYGGTSAGVVAAYSAKKMGKSVILIEPGKYLGGMTTGGLGSTDIGNKYAVTGLARLFYRRVGEHYNKFEQWMFPPSVATKVMNQFVTDADLDVLFQYRMKESNVQNTTIESIVIESSTGEQPDMTIKAKQFIDCSYEGDLMASSGISYATGREDCSVYNETLNGVQMSYWHQFPDGVDPYIIEGDSASGYCWGINQNTLKEIGSGDNLIQAYNFRLCLTDVESNRVPFTKPANYDPSHYELLARAMKKMDADINQFLLINWGQMPENKYDVNNRGPLSTDYIGMNYDYPDGDYETRSRIWQEHVDYTKGLMYFLTHDDRVPEKIRQAVSKFGWAKDEFVDNDNFPTQLYVREARRMKGEYIMTQKDCQGERIVDDGIGLAAYIMDSHNCQRIVINGMVKNEGDVESGGFAPYPISYRSITPKRNECTNLVVPVCVSASHIAYGSIRMEPVFMVLGQSAAVASVLALNAQTAVQDVDVEQLRKILTEDPYLDGTTPEILLDDSDKENVSLEGGWKDIPGYFYKSSYAYAENRKGAFHIEGEVKKNGKYQVLFYCSASIPAKQMPSMMPVSITTNDKTYQAVVKAQKNVGEWDDLGVYELNSGKVTFTVKTDVKDGTPFFDAVILKPIN